MAAGSGPILAPALRAGARCRAPARGRRPLPRARACRSARRQARVRGRAQRPCRRSLRLHRRPLHAARSRRGAPSQLTALPRPGADRVPRRHRRRPRDDPVRDPGGHRLPRWRGVRVLRPRGGARQARRAGRRHASSARSSSSGATWRTRASGRRWCRRGRVEDAHEAASETLDGLIPEEWRGRRRAVGLRPDRSSRSTAWRRPWAPASTPRPSRPGSRPTRFFEFGPELSLRSIAPAWSRAVEGLVWFGAEGNDGLAKLIAERKPAPRGARDAAGARRGARGRRRRAGRGRRAPPRWSPTPRSSCSARGSRPC